MSLTDKQTLKLQTQAHYPFPRSYGSPQTYGQISRLEGGSLSVAKFDVYQRTDGGALVMANVRAALSTPLASTRTSAEIGTLSLLKTKNQ